MGIDSFGGVVEGGNCCLIATTLIMQMIRVRPIHGTAEASKNIGGVLLLLILSLWRVFVVCGEL